MLRKFTITARMIFLLVFMLLFALGIGLTFLSYMGKVQDSSLREAEEVMHKGYERTLQTSVDSFASQLEVIYDEAKKLGQDPDEAIRKALQHVRYGTDGYFFIYDTEGVTVAMPVAPKMVGTSRIDLKDKRGNEIIKEMLKTAKNGGGFYTYWYPKPGETEASPKKAYVRFIGNTKNWIGSGVYVDSIETERARIENHLEEIVNSAQMTVGIAVGVVLIFLVLPLAFAIVRSILVPLKAATQNAQEVPKATSTCRSRSKAATRSRAWRAHWT